MLEHVDLQVEHLRRQFPEESPESAEHHAIRELRKHLLWYTRGRRGGVFFRRDAPHLKTRADVARLVDQHFPAGGDAFEADPAAAGSEDFE